MAARSTLTSPTFHKLPEVRGTRSGLRASSWGGTHITLRLRARRLSLQGYTRLYTNAHPWDNVYSSLLCSIGPIARLGNCHRCEPEHAPPMSFVYSRCPRWCITSCALINACSRLSLNPHTLTTFESPERQALFLHNWVTRHLSLQLPTPHCTQHTRVNFLTLISICLRPQVQESSRRRWAMRGGATARPRAVLLSSHAVGFTLGTTRPSHA